SWRRGVPPGRRGHRGRDRRLRHRDRGSSGGALPSHGGPAGCGGQPRGRTGRLPGVARPAEPKLVGRLVLRPAARQGPPVQHLATWVESLSTRKIKRVGPPPNRRVSKEGGFP